MPHPLTPLEVNELANYAHIDRRTVKKWLGGAPCLPIVEVALRRAYKRMGFEARHSAPATTDAAAAPHTRGARAISFVKPAKF